MSNTRLKDLVSADRPAPLSTRGQQTERAYRNAMTQQLHALLAIMNPQDLTLWGAMRYDELVKYSLDWLKTELKAVHAQPGDEEPLGPLSL